MFCSLTKIRKCNSKTILNKKLCNCIKLELNLTENAHKPQ